MPEGVGKAGTGGGEGRSSSMWRKMALVNKVTASSDVTCV